MLGKVFLWPVGFSLNGYKLLMEYKEIWTGYANTIFYTLVGTTISVMVTVPAGYVLSRRTLPFRKAINIYCIITMFVSGGMIPGYFLIKNLGLLNTRLVILILGSASVWNMTLCRTFFDTSISKSIIEAAKIDGCSEIVIFGRIILPLSKSILAVMALYFGVGRWNDYYTGLLYLSDTEKWPLQLVIRTILDMSSVNPENMANGMQQLMNIQLMRYSLVIVASLPVLIAYPFVQKYFVQGVMIGAVKE